MQRTFESVLPRNLQQCTTPPDLDAAAVAVIMALNEAARVSIPTKVVKLKGPARKASPTLSQRLKSSKVAFASWKAAGRPGPIDPLSIERKIAKKAVRQQQRLETTEERKYFYEQVMSDINTANFHKLIRKQRKTNTSTTAIMVNGELCFDRDAQREEWASYFESLGTPSDQPEFDDLHHQSVLEQLDLLSQLVSQCADGQPYTTEEIGRAIDRLNSGKAPDEWQLVAEHLKATRSTLVPVLCVLFNLMRQMKYIPTCMKTGVITPVPKKDKSKTQMTNYRGITITAILGKTLEQVIMNRMGECQSQL